MIDYQTPDIVLLWLGASAPGVLTAIATLRGHRFRDFTGGVSA